MQSDDGGKPLYLKLYEMLTSGMRGTVKLLRGNRRQP